MAYDLLGLESDVFRYDVETQAGQATCLLKLVCRGACHRTRCTPSVGNLADMQITRLHSTQKSLWTKASSTAASLPVECIPVPCRQSGDAGILAGRLPNSMHLA